MAADPIETSADEVSEAKSGSTAVAEKSSTKTASKLSASELLREFEDAQLKNDLPEIYVGDTVRVGIRISEGGIFHGLLQRNLDFEQSTGRCIELGTN